MHRFALHALTLSVFLSLSSALGPYLRAQEYFSVSEQNFPDEAAWTKCGPPDAAFQCTSIQVPLDYFNPSDTESVKLAITRLPAKNHLRRRGAIFMAPGGPGASGKMFAYLTGQSVWEVLQGHYDVIGLDPRGLISSDPHISCFHSRLEQDISDVMTSGYFNHPVTSTRIENETVAADITRQVALLSAHGRSVGAQCARMTGRVLQFIGTEYVAYDFDRVAKTLYGDQEPLNFWGFSYGSVIGQYLLQLLPAHRLGHIILDGVFDADVWTAPIVNAVSAGLVDTDIIFSRFAEACSATNGSNACALGNQSAEEIISSLDGLIDALYHHPIPIQHQGSPQILQSSDIISLLIAALHMPAGWPTVANALRSALFDNDFKAIAHRTLPTVQRDGMDRPGTHTFSNLYVFCADAPPPSLEFPMPTTAEIADSIMDSLLTRSGRFGSAQAGFALCYQYSADVPSGHRFTGNFSLSDGQLHTPVLVLSNEYDPVTPLAHASNVSRRLGSNARLISQRGGSGHCSLSQVSFCTARRVRDFLLHDMIPEEYSQSCDVEERPFEDFDAIEPGAAHGRLNDPDLALWKAWKKLCKSTHALFGYT